MAKNTKTELRKVSFRIPQEKYEKVEHLVKTREYKDISQFLRNAVDYKLYYARLLKWEEFAKVIDLNDGFYIVNDGPAITDKMMDKLLDESQQQLDEFKKKIYELEKNLGYIKSTNDNTLILLENSVEHYMKFIEIIYQELKKIYQLPESKGISGNIRLLTLKIELFKEQSSGIRDHNYNLINKKKKKLSEKKEYKISKTDRIIREKMRKLVEKEKEMKR